MPIKPDKEDAPTPAELAHDFIEGGGIFSQLEQRGFEPPDRLTRFCERCTRDTTWTRMSKTEANIAGKNFSCLGYQCALCKGATLSVILRVVGWVPEKYVGPSGEETHHIPVTFEKIGQFPRPSIKISPEIAKALGESADLYRKALVCRNQGYGIAAMAYLRRVVEDKTNDLIEVVEQLAAASQVSDADVAKIRAAREQKTTYDQKLKLASEAIPNALRPSGANSLGLLYGFVSAGLHGKSEVDCLKTADEIRDVFEYVFGKLRAQVEDQKNFVAKVQKWAGSQK